MEIMEKLWGSTIDIDIDLPFDAFARDRVLWSRREDAPRPDVMCMSHFGLD